MNNPKYVYSCLYYKNVDFNKGRESLLYSKSFKSLIDHKENKNESVLRSLAV